jgi:hypothetical protein
MFKIKPQMSQKAFTARIGKTMDDLMVQDQIAMALEAEAILSKHIIELVRSTLVWQDFNSKGFLWKRLGGGVLVSRLEAIAEHWASSITWDANTVKVGGSYESSIEIRAIKADYSDVLSIPPATFKSITTVPGPYQGKTHEIKWLEWLLTKGRTEVVKNYVFGKNIDSTVSRSGGPIMIRKKGAGWRIPSQFSGTLDDNFLTKALDEHLDSIVDDIFRRIT